MWLNNLLFLLYPPYCLLCKKLLIDTEQHICMHCQCDLPYTNYHLQTNHPIQKLFDGYSQLKETGSFLCFEKEGHTQQLIHSIKYHGNQKLGKHMGRMAASTMKANGIYSEIDYILPVPLHAKKKRLRGYNQSECIAQGFASVYQYPISTNTLFRLKNTSSQTRKSAYDRHLNVEHIFRLKEPNSLAGKHVLLIDDVITTGATIKACMDTLITTPDIRISLFSLAIAQ